MPLLRRPYSGSYDDEHRRSSTVPLAALVALLSAGAIGWAIGRGGGAGTTTRTVTHSVTTLATPPSVQQHTPHGAVAAAEANLVQAETSCVGGGRCQSPAAYSLGPDGGGLWSLAYRIKSYSPLHAVVEAWQLQISAGGSAPSTLAWELALVTVSWTGSRWTQIGQVSQVAVGPTPPPDETAGAASRWFARTIATFARFPGAP